ncbi:protein piccolo [Caerostris darwini]|uniref:Protein piccolo n=1 Tax=Caerostris darwini TaxID=1538125 RepID=A0AAV4WAC4_9ARAC|nr:protein piccolo [Caerostris darwini]
MLKFLKSEFFRCTWPQQSERVRHACAERRVFLNGWESRLAALSQRERKTFVRDFYRFHHWPLASAWRPLPDLRALAIMLRRHTDTGLVFSGLDPYGRGGSGHRKARSWHPSPHASEDEEEREERKAKVKAEIARRRQHIEDRLHDELYKVARFRDHTDDADALFISGGGYVSPAYNDRLYTSPISLDSGGSSQDPDLDPDYFLRRYPTYSSTFPAYGKRSTATHSSYLAYGGSPWEHEWANDEPLILDGYDYSPLATTDSETDLAPMPLLPDMPTRSRKLLHDLGSAPLYDKQYRTHGWSPTS